MNKFFKSVVAAVIAFAIGSSVYAAPAVYDRDTSSKSECISINGKIDNPNGNYNANVVILPAGKTLSDYLNGFVRADYVNAITAEFDGNYSVKIPFNKYGEFTIYVFSDSYLEQTSLNWYSYGDIETFINDIANKSLSGITLFNKLAKYSVSMGGCDLSDVETDTEKQLISKRVLAANINRDIDSSISKCLSAVEAAREEYKLLMNIKNAAHYSSVSLNVSALSSLTGVKMDYGNASHQAVDTKLMGIMFANAEEVADKISSLASSPNNNNNYYGGGSSGKSDTSASVGYDIPRNTEKEPEITAVFDDLTGIDWAKEAIVKLAAKGVVNGVGERKFRPNDFVTREQFVKLIVSAFNVQSAGSAAIFYDVTGNEWYAPYVKASAEAGIVKGMENGNFGVGQYITRQDMAVMLYRCAKKYGYELNTAEEIIEYSDTDKISDYAKEAIDILSKSEVIKGVNGCVLPTDNTTRAQAAVMIYRMLEISEK